MVGKSSVSALQEFCARKKIGSPVYDFIDSDDGGFVCKVELLDMSAHANGRSKRDAKHQAAANVIKKLRVSHPDIDEIPQASVQEIPTHDMIIQLRDYCVQHQHPLPTIEIVQQGGTPDAPEFTAVCKIASIRRYGVSEKKKDARQLAALEMFKIISDDGYKMDHQMQVVSLDDKNSSAEEERYKKFKTYREFTESTNGEMPGVLLSDRHNFFTHFYDDLKKAAREVIATPYDSYEEQAIELLRALKIKPKIREMAAVSSAEPMIFIELDCEYDAVFAGLRSKVYKNVVQYFTDML